ncbi:MAG: hypothetical protein JRD68_13195 [Deltaproteobacteria bacterium]|nr:hypothetical protein [Deltaproteobacteria bacterium]
MKSFARDAWIDGLFTGVREICKAHDIKEHAFNLSPGIFGSPQEDRNAFR